MSDNELTDEPNLFLSNDVDQMTMELLMNKNSKQKYKSKMNPDVKLMHLDQNNELLKYKAQILELTEQKINNSHTQINGDVDTIFDAYTLACIRHFKQKEVENSNLFHQDLPLESPKKVKRKQKNVFSYWSDEKVIRKDYYDDYDDGVDL